MPRTLKLVVPERGGVLSLPVCALILSVGFQRERAPRPPWESKPAPTTPTAVAVADKAPIDDFADDDEEFTEYNVTITDRRTGKPEVRRARINPGADQSAEVNALMTAYDKRGFDMNSALSTATPPTPQPVATPEPEANLVPVLWFQAPNTEAVDFDEDAWPKVNVPVEVVPTGGSPALPNMVFVGTLQRPQRQNPAMDAVFHIFVQKSEFISIR